MTIAPQLYVIIQPQLTPSDTVELTALHLGVDMVTEDGPEPPQIDRDNVIIIDGQAVVQSMTNWRVWTKHVTWVMRSLSGSTD